MPRTILCLVLLCSFFSLSRLSAQTPTATSTTPAKDKGTAIGTTVRAALDVAFPGAGTLADVLITAATNKVKMNKEDKAKATEAAKKAAEDVKAKATNAANTELKKLNSLATQLDVVTQFADAATTANEYIIPLVIYLETHSKPTDDEWNANVKSKWNVIKNNLDPLNAYRTAGVLSADVKDTYVYDTLFQIIKAQNTLIVDLDTLVKDKPSNISQIKAGLQSLQPILSNVGRVGALQVQLLSYDLHHLALPQEQGGRDTKEKELQKRVDDIMDKLPKTSPEQ